MRLPGFLQASSNSEIQHKDRILWTFSISGEGFSKANMIATHQANDQAHWRQWSAAELPSGEALC